MANVRPKDLAVRAVVDILDGDSVLLDSTAGTARTTIAGLGTRLASEGPTTTEVITLATTDGTTTTIWQGTTGPGTFAVVYLYAVRTGFLETGGLVAARHVRWTIGNEGPPLIGSPIDLHADVGNYTVSFDGDSNDLARVRVTGAEGENVSWTLRIEHW